MVGSSLNQVGPAASMGLAERVLHHETTRSFQHHVLSGLFSRWPIFGDRRRRLKGDIFHEINLIFTALLVSKTLDMVNALIL